MPTVVALDASLLAALMLGAGLGAGLCAIAVGLVPPKPSLAAALARLTSTDQPVPATPPTSAGWVGWVGRPLTGLLTAAGLPRPRLRRDLVVVDKPIQQHLAEQASCALAGLLFPPALAAIAAIGGLQLGWLIPAWVSLALAAVGLAAPDLAVRAAAARRREQLRHALSSYLDLVVISLAGGSGVDGALTEAASIGHGWAAAQLRQALDTARLTRTSPWTTLGQLGHDLGLPELVELAATITLAGTEGARVRTSLTAKAAALRAHQLADAETRAATATERMALPLMILFAGYLLFIGYPAVAAVLGDL